MRPSLILLVLWPAAVAATPSFEPRPAPDHVYDGGWEHFVGGGLASFDCNGDNMPELYAAGGDNPAQLLLNNSTSGGPVLFSAAAESSISMLGVIGAYPLDIDSDGYLDLAILRVGENHLMRGLGNCDFAAFSELEFASDARWSTAFSATWERGSALPTLAIGNYVDREDPDGPFEACDTNQIYRPAGQRYSAPDELEPGYCALSILFSDWGRQGRMDLRVSNDRHYYVRDGQEQMWAMEATPRLYGSEDGWQSHQLWGMGIASRDVSGDGLPEVYLTSMGDQRFQFLNLNADGPHFLDAPFDLGATAHRPYTGDDGRPSTGWHAVFGDVDNDGFDDLFVTKGNVEQMPGSAMADPNNLLMGRADGGFIEAGLEAGIATMNRSRGAVMVDLNADGLLDIAVVNRRAPLEIYQNVTSQSGNWLLVEASQAGTNPDGVGAIVELRSNTRAWTQEITVGGGHAGGSAGPLHFGMGDAETAEIRVIWPDGQESEWQPVTSNSRITIAR